MTMHDKAAQLQESIKFDVDRLAALKRLETSHQPQPTTDVARLTYRTRREPEVELHTWVVRGMSGWQAIDLGAMRTGSPGGWARVVEAVFGYGDRIPVRITTFAEASATELDGGADR
jgi:hypothetical protein